MIRQFYVINVKVKDNLTDSRAVEYLKSWDFTKYDWRRFEETIMPFYNPAAERIIRFFVTYDKVNLIPDLYNAYEPINLPFGKDNISNPINMLSFPAGRLHFKMKRRFTAFIENLNYGIIYDPYNNYKVIPSRKKIGAYLGDIKIFLKISKYANSFDLMKRTINDMCEYLHTDYGAIYHLDTGEVFYQYSE